MRDHTTPALRIHPSRITAGVSIGLAFVFVLGCGGTQTRAPSTPLEPTVGQLAPAKSRVCDEDGLLYRYYAQKVGQNLAIKGYCEGAADTTPSVALPRISGGGCPVTRCGQVSTSARSPMAPALLSAVVDLAKYVQVKVGSQSRALAGEVGATEESHHGAQVNETVRFQLQPGVTCISRLKLYSDQHDVTTEVDVALAADRRRRGVAAKKEFTMDTMETGDVYMEQRRTEEGYRLVLLAETAYDGDAVGELVNEQTMCLSPQGPIRLDAITQYGFSTTPGEDGIIQVFAFPVAPSPSDAPQETP